MKNTLFTLCTLFAVLFSSQSFSQSKFTIHVTGGYSLPLGDFKSDIVSPDTTTTNWPYRMKSGFNVGAVGKLALGKTANFRLTFGFNYSSFSNEGTVSNVYGTVIPPNSVNLAYGASRTFNPKVSLITISLGGEYAFMPAEKINPFVGLDITSNFWGGSFKFTPADTGVYRDQDMKAEARFGLQLNGGCEFKLSNQIGLVVGLKYNMANLVGKGQDDASEIGPNEIDLSDKAHGNFPARNVSYLQTYAGLSIYFGFPKSSTK